jgi:hypothetical protein
VSQILEHLPSKHEALSSYCQEKKEALIFLISNVTWREIEIVGRNYLFQLMASEVSVHHSREGHVKWSS